MLGSGDRDEGAGLRRKEPCCTSWYVFFCHCGWLTNANAPCCHLDHHQLPLQFPLLQHDNTKTVYEKIKHDYVQLCKGTTTTNTPQPQSRPGRTAGARGFRESKQINQCTTGTISAPQHDNEVGGEETKDRPPFSSRPSPSQP